MSLELDGHVGAMATDDSFVVGAALRPSLGR
jgi:hypothetical protein